MTGKEIIVDGASGYVGLHLVKALRERGYAVRALVRPRVSEASVRTLESLGASIFRADLTICQGSANAETLHKAFDRANFAVHLIGSIAPRRSETFDNLHPQSAKAFAHWAKLAHIEKAVMLTALGANTASVSQYLRTKALAENCVREELGDSRLIIFRPSLIVGRQVGQRDSKLVKRYVETLKNKAFVPLIGGGKNLIEPVFVGDLCQAICQALAQEDYSGVVEIGGERRITMRQFVEELAAAISINKPFISIAPALAQGLAGISQALSEVPALSKDQALLATMDNVTVDNRLPALLEHAPASLADVLKVYAAK